MKYRFKLSKTVIFISVIVLILTITSFLYTLLRLIEVAGLVSSNRTSEIMMATVSIFILIFTILNLVFSVYIIKERFLYIIIALIPTKIDIDKILVIRYDYKIKIPVIYFQQMGKDGKPKISQLVLSIKEKDLSSFVEEIKSKNSKILYQEFNNEEEKI